MNCTLALALAGICQITVAVDDVCPSDRPNARTMTIYPTVQQCTLVACLPKIVCGDKTCVSVTSDCNTCSPQPETKTICLSDEDLRNASK